MYVVLLHSNGACRVIKFILKKDTHMQHTLRHNTHTQRHIPTHTNADTQTL